MKFTREKMAELLRRDVVIKIPIKTPERQILSDGFTKDELEKVTSILHQPPKERVIKPKKTK